MLRHYAVKHFKWKPRGKRRIHEKPTRDEATRETALADFIADLNLVAKSIGSK
jgi:hypothetical protein